MTGDWTFPRGTNADASGTAAGREPARAPDESHAAALPLAYRTPPADLPDDFARLLARLK